MSAALQTVSAASAVNDPGIGSTVVLVDTANANWHALDVVTFPAAPTARGQITVKDATGSADSKAIAIDPNGQTLEGPTVLVIPYAAQSYVFTGTAWVRI